MNNKYTVNIINENNLSVLRVKMILVYLVILFISAFLLFVLKWFSVHYRRIKYTAKIPRPKQGSFILGNTNTLFADEDELFKNFRQFAKEYYPHYSLRILHATSVNILSPEDCEIFMNTKKHSTKSIIYEIMESWLKEGLLTSKGEKWTERRKILTPAFRFSILKGFIKVFNEGIQPTVDTLTKNSSEPVNVCALTADYTLRSICETAMGYKLDEKDESTKKYFQAVHEISAYMQYRIMRPWLKPSFVYFFTFAYWQERKRLKILHDFTRKIIKEKMNAYQESSDVSTADGSEDNEDVYMGKKKRKLAMLDILLEAQRNEGSIDYEGICEEVDTFMFEGHDTIATALSFCLMLLANHPTIQDKIVEEIETVMEGRTDLTYEDLQKMDYMERCIKESLRLYPSVFFISREAEEDTVLNSGYMIAEGTIVHFHIFDILRNPRVFPNPDVFDPDRFLVENCQNRHPFAYIPFSAGPRNCIGQKFALLEMKAFLTGVLSNFVLSPIDTPESIVLVTHIVLRSKNGIKVKFTPRMKKS